MVPADNLLRIAYQNTGEEIQVRLSELSNALTGFLDHFAVDPLVGKPFCEIVQAGDGRTKLSRLLEACGHRDDAEGFFRKLLAELGRADGSERSGAAGTAPGSRRHGRAAPNQPGSSRSGRRRPERPAPRCPEARRSLRTSGRRRREAPRHRAPRRGTESAPIPSQRALPSRAPCVSRTPRTRTLPSTRDRSPRAARRDPSSPCTA